MLCNEVEGRELAMLNATKESIKTAKVSLNIFKKFVLCIC